MPCLIEWHIGCHEDFYAIRMGFGFADVDFIDPSPRIFGTNRLGINHVRQYHIVRIHARTECLFYGIHAMQQGPNLTGPVTFRNRCVFTEQFSGQ